MASNHTFSSASSPLDLSALNSDVEYKLPLDTSAKRCLLHVKLTESCSKAIDNLINSNRGAVFSLWFNESGGNLTLPSSTGSHTFQFSTAAPNKREQNSSLECFHQLVGQDRQQQLLTMGKLEHKLTVKATDDVYKATKEKARKLEEERQGVRAKEIKIPKVMKTKAAQLTNNSYRSSTHKPGSDSMLTGRTPISSVGGAGVGGRAPHGTSTGRAKQKSLKDRVIHILAVKPCRQADIVSKLKKATKRSENYLSGLDSVLNEVANFQDSSYHLKDLHYTDLDVDTWPFYSEAEKDLVKRKLSMMSRASLNSSSGSFTVGSSVPSTSTTSVKRPTDEAASTDHAPPKRPKILPEPTPNTGHTSSTQGHASSAQGHASSSSQVQFPSIGTSKQGPETTSKGEHKSQQPSDMKTELSSNDLPNYASKFLSKRYITEEAPPTQTISLSNNNHSDQKIESGRFDDPQQRGLLGVVNEDRCVNEGVEPVKGTVEEGEEKIKKSKKKKKKKHKMEEKVLTDVADNGSVLPSDGAGCPTGVAAGGGGELYSERVGTSNSQLPASDEPQHTGQTSQTGQIGDANGSGSEDALLAAHFANLYPEIQSSEQRAEYKKMFNDEYREYLVLKNKMDSIQEEVSQLSDQLSSLPGNSLEVKEVKRKIKKKYMEMQQDTTYHDERKRLFTLHYKLDHIKKMVVSYDKQHSS